MLQYETAMKHFREIESKEAYSWPDDCWHGEIENCDVCSRPFDTEEYMIDGPAYQGRGLPWGNLCVVCALKSAPIMGIGKGQLYRYDGGKWRLVAGGHKDILEM